MQVRPLSTAVKCLELLDVLALQPSSARLADIGRLIGESRATTYQRLVTLVAAGWVERLPDGSYRLSTRACRIGASALLQAGFGERAQPVLEELAKLLGDAVSLVMLEQDKLIITQRAEAHVVLRADLRVGSHISYKDSASGAIWLAFGPADLLVRLRDAGEKLPTKSQIEKVRSEGVSIGGGGKTLPGIGAMAVPVLDPSGQCLASLSISSPEGRFNPTRLLPAMRKGADRLAFIHRGQAS